MSETIYRKVMCSERLPEKDGMHVAKSWKGICNHSFNKVQHTLNKQTSDWLLEIEWWLEEVSINQIKAEAWDEGFDEAINYANEADNYLGLTEEFRKAENIKSPLKPENPYKEEPEPPTWEAPDAWDGGFADNH